MKRTVILALVSLVLMFAFTALTVGGILSVSVQNPGGENLTLKIPESMGTGAVDTPLTTRQLQKKYEKFNTVTQENGKTAVTIFSEEQIDDFNKRREQGEWFWLSTEEMLFLIEDTIRLFETYDLVYIRGLDGVLHKYYGLSFFSSEEYYASFGGFDLGVTDASFDMRKDVYKTILERSQTLSSASGVFPNDSPFVILDMEKPLTEGQMETIKEGKNPCYKTGTYFGVALFFFEKIHYHKQDPNDTLIGAANEAILYSRDMDLGPVSYSKYDQNNEKVVVLELYDEESQSLVARLRFDSESDPNIIAQYEEKSREFLIAGEPENGLFEKFKTYRAVIYLSGFPSESITFRNEKIYAIHYCPIGSPNQLIKTFDSRIFEYQWMYQKISDELTRFTNDLLSEYLQIEF